MGERISLNDTIQNDIKITDIKAQYDDCAKRLLSNKIILAHILKETVDDFKEMDVLQIIPLIEGEPYVSEVSLEPGETNQTMRYSGNKISGSNTENSEIKEGKVYFDILFYVRKQDGISQILVNIEAQRSATPGYYIKNRAIYYTSRMLSSQKERDFVNSNYNDMIKTYSIWICFNLDENCLNYLHMVDTPLLGNHIWDGDTDLLNVVLVGLNKELTKASLHETESDLHYLLGVLFSNKLNVEEKIGLLSTRFSVEEEMKIREELNNMCNLSYEILEDGIKQGISGVIKEMLLDHQTYIQIKKYTGASESTIKEIEESLSAKEE